MGDRAEELKSLQEEMYKKYKLTAKEIEVIESVIKERK